MCKQEILYQIKNDNQNAENKIVVSLTFEIENGPNDDVTMYPMTS